MFCNYILVHPSFIIIDGFFYNLFEIHILHFFKKNQTSLYSVSTYFLWTSSLGYNEYVNLSLEGFVKLRFTSLIGFSNSYNYHKLKHRLLYLGYMNYSWKYIRSMTVLKYDDIIKRVTWSCYCFEIFWDFQIQAIMGPFAPPILYFLFN